MKKAFGLFQSAFLTFGFTVNAMRFARQNRNTKSCEGKTNSFSINFRAASYILLNKIRNKTEVIK